MKFIMGYVGNNYNLVDISLSDLAYCEEIEVLPELIPSDQLLDDAFFENLISTDLDNDIQEYICHSYENILDDIILSVSLSPKSQYSLEEVSSFIIEETKQQLLDETVNTHLVCLFINDKQVLFRSEYDLHAFLKKWVMDRENGEQSYIDAGHAMIQGTEQFINESVWQYAWLPIGETNKAIMWFGLKDDMPEDGWILNRETDLVTGETWHDYWFNNDWASRVLDDGDILDYWMGMECSDYLPSRAEALKSCPVVIDEQDDYESLTEKVAELLAKKQCE